MLNALKKDVSYFFEEARSMPVLTPMAKQALKEILYQRARDEGKVEGIAEGEAKGKAEGEVMGMFRKAADVARKLLARKTSLSEIAELTGLSESDILGLQTPSR
jgi:predicted transposase YdaD